MRSKNDQEQQSGEVWISWLAYDAYKAIPVKEERKRTPALKAKEDKRKTFLS